MSKPTPQLDPNATPSVFRVYTITTSYTGTIKSTETCTLGTMHKVACRHYPCTHYLEVLFSQRLAPLDLSPSTLFPDSLYVYFRCLHIKAAGLSESVHIIISCFPSLVSYSRLPIQSSNVTCPVVLSVSQVSKPSCKHIGDAFCSGNCV